MYGGDEGRAAKGDRGHMSIFSEVLEIAETMNLPAETAAFTSKPPDEYLVITPLPENFEAFGDDVPILDIKAVRLSLFSRGNYILRKDELVKRLIQSGFTITDRQYIGREDDTKFHHVAIDVIKEYEYEGGLF